MGLFDDERLTISVTQAQRRKLGELVALDQGLDAVSKAMDQEQMAAAGQPQGAVRASPQ